MDGSLNQDTTAARRRASPSDLAGPPGGLGRGGAHPPDRTATPRSRGVAGQLDRPDHPSLIGRAPKSSPHLATAGPQGPPRGRPVSAPAERGDRHPAGAGPAHRPRPLSGGGIARIRTGATPEPWRTSEVIPGLLGRAPEPSSIVYGRRSGRQIGSDHCCVSFRCGRGTRSFPLQGAVRRPSPAVLRLRRSVRTLSCVSCRTPGGLCRTAKRQGREALINYIYRQSNIVSGTMFHARDRPASLIT